MTEDTYTHRPGEVADERGGRASDGESEDEASDTPVEDATAHAEDATKPVDDAAPPVEDPAVQVEDPAAPVERGREEWSWRDWLLVGVIVLCFLVIPATILVLPPAAPYRFAYLVLPMIPALLLGAVAVWSAQRSG